MGKLKKFHIVYDNSSAIFYPGQIITGQVIVVLSEPMEMRGIELEYKGSADVRWTDTSSDKRDGTKTTYRTASEIYLMQSHKLFGYDDDETSPPDEQGVQETSPGKKQTLPAGEHTFRFSYTLRDNLPSSFEGEYGHVRYCCRAVIHRPWKFNSLCKMPFTVVSVLDLNQQPGATVPVTREFQKQQCCLCCTIRPLALTARIDKTGYVPGESIILNAEIENLSIRKISYSKAVLKSKITYSTRDSSITEIRNLIEVERGLIEQGYTDKWNDEPIPIPSVAPSFLNGCENINIDYYIEFVIEPIGAKLRPTVTLPIVIGTIPLKQNFSSFLPKPPKASPAVTAEFSPSAPRLPQYPDAPLPSFEECALGQVGICDDEDNEYTYGKLKYAPFYTYYNLREASVNKV